MQKLVTANENNEFMIENQSISNLKDVQSKTNLDKKCKPCDNLNFLNESVNKTDDKSTRETRKSVSERPHSTERPNALSANIAINSKKIETFQNVKTGKKMSNKLLHKRDFSQFQTSSIQATNCSTNNVPSKSKTEKRCIRSQQKNRLNFFNRTEKNYFEKISMETLTEKIENCVEESYKINDFCRRDGFIHNIKDKFGSSLNDKNMEKHVNLINLKIVWAQFLLKRKISRSHLKGFSAFEKIIFLVYLRRFGFIADIKKYGKLDDAAAIEQLSNLNQKSENRLLRFALKQMFKKIMYSFFNKHPRRRFETDLRPIKISKNENVKMTCHYFSDIMREDESIEDYMITEDTLSRTSSMVHFIRRMARSPRMCAFVDACFGKSGSDESGFLAQISCKPGDLNSKTNQLLLRQQNEILNKINQRVTNFEIILNQFNPVFEKNKIIEWMAIIVRDFKLNPNLNVCWGFGELKESFQVFFKYFNHFRKN